MSLDPVHHRSGQAARSRVAPEPAVHVTYLRLLCALLQARGIDPAPALAAAGVSQAELAAGSHVVGLSRLKRFVAAAGLGEHLDGLGLALGALAQGVAHGPVGYAAASAPDLGAMLRVLARYGALRSGAVQFELDLRERAAGESEAALVLHEARGLGELRQLVLEATVVIVDRLVASLFGRALPPPRIEFAYRTPPWRERYAEHLDAPLRFGAGRTALVWPVALLATPCLMADAAAHAHACQQCERELEVAGDELLGRVRALLAEHAEGFPAQAEVAQRLHVSQRTLMRHLRARGTRWRALLDGARREQAAWHLLHSREPVERIAARLGYQDSSNFSRSFRRWFGVTPSEYRARLSLGTTKP
jgi:AraC-like DNA-binding protein